MPCSVDPIQTVRASSSAALLSAPPRVTIEHRPIACRDMPPQGGFDAIKYKRNLPFRGPGGVAILGGVTAICAYGFYRVGQGNLEKR